MVDGTVDTSTTTAITAATVITGSLPDQITAQIRAGVESLCHRHDATTEDVLRMYRDQISNMFLTEQVRSAMRLDPFQHLKEQIPIKDLERILSSISVVSHHSVTTMEGYVRTEAVVSLSHVDTNNGNNNNNKKKRPRANHQHSEAPGALQLHFTYLRSAMTSISPCTVSYTIDLCRTATSTSSSTSSSSSSSGFPSQPLLWIHVSAAGAVPASHNSSHAIDINKIDNNDDDQWSDIDDDEQNGEVVDDVTNDASAKDRQTSRRNTESVHHIASTTGSDTVAELNDNLELNTNNTNERIDHHDDDDDEDDRDDIVDRYAAGMDPDVVSVLIAHLTFLNKTTNDDNDEHEHNYDDVTIFFWLMTFPFYEHEWDLVGFLLKAVFDNDDDDSIDGDDVSDDE